MLIEQVPGLKLISVPRHVDERGTLCFIQNPDTVPFQIRRMFYFYDVPDGEARGGHAHREQHQLIVMMCGKCRVTADDGRGRAVIDLDTPSKALHVPPGIWLDLDGFAQGSVGVVLTSDVFKESDYIRNRQDFSRFKQG